MLNINGVISIGLIFQLTFQTSTVVAFSPYRVYEIVGNAEVSWHEATQYCLEQEYDDYDFTLASIYTDDDYEALKEVKDSVSPERNQIADGQPFWIGLYRDALGDFLWADGTPCETNDGLCVNDWLETPVDDGRNCVTLTVDLSTRYKGYKTVSCNSDYRFICSFINGTTPVPLNEDPPIGTCEGGDTYSITGQQCWVAGYGHFATWSGARHDYQGNPHMGYEDFYYVAPCADASTADLPFTIIGHHYPLEWGNYKLSTTDYITLELFKDSYGSQNKYDKYYLWFSSGIQAYIAATDANSYIYGDIPSYDCHSGDPDLVTLSAGDFQAIGDDGKFEVKYTLNGYLEVWLKIDGVQQLHFTMRALWIVVGDRYRTHQLILDVPTNYRCFICGLCGDFKRARNGNSLDPQTLITCNGELIDYQWGWAKTQPNWQFAYNLNGATWEYEYVNAKCPLYEPEDGASAAHQIEPFVDEIGNKRVGYQPPPIGDWNDSNDSGVVIEITSTWIVIAGLLLLLFLTIFCGYICYVNASTPQRGKRGYSAVKYIESDYDSEAAIIQRKN